MNRTIKFTLGALCVLILPLCARLAHLNGFDWSLSDYAIAAVLLTGFGAALAYATGPRSATQRVAGIGIVVLVLVIYVHFAVGIVDTWPLAGS